MGLFDILGSGTLTTALQAIAQQALTNANAMDRKAPQGLDALLGAGALGSLLGALPGGAMQKTALLGAGAVAWNFYKKWAAEQERAAARQDRAQQQFQQEQRGGWGEPQLMRMDDTAVLLIRAMIFAARADGRIDAAEQDRIVAVVRQMAPGQDMTPILQQAERETIDPSALARQVRTPEQGEDLYRLSCMVIDVDHFMERNYLDALAESLGISPGRRASLEGEAGTAKKHMALALGQA